jgi:hypothetical protein
VAQILQAIANFALYHSTHTIAYLQELASIEAIVSHIIVIVVFGAEYVEGILIIAFLTVQVSAHFITIHLAKILV